MQGGEPTLQAVEQLGVVLSRLWRLWQGKSDVGDQYVTPPSNIQEGHILKTGWLQKVVCLLYWGLWRLKYTYRIVSRGENSFHVPLVLQ